MSAANPTTRPVRNDILRNGDDMNDANPALQRLGAALDSGDRGAVMACFAPDANVDVLTGHKRMAFTGKSLGKAIDTLWAGFDDITLTPSTRQVSGSQVVEDSVLSGSHTGIFAGAEPTQGRVHVNVKLSATAGPDSLLTSLRIDTDTRALFAQIAETGDIIGVGGRLIAGARERHTGVRIIDAPPPPVLHPAPVSSASHADTPSAKGSPGRWAGLTGGSSPKGTSVPGHEAPPGTTRSRRKWAALTAVPVLLLIVFLALRHGSSDSSQTVADHPKPITTSSPVASSKPTAAPKPKPTASIALPVIATEAPKSVPHVQAGQQLVLRSDVLFALNSAALTPTAKAAVTTLATQIRSAHVTGTIQINGYTDNLGTVAKNLSLSQARALAVAQVLQASLAGQPVTLAPQGFGQASPVVPNSSDANRARNRRVTIVLPKIG